MLRQNGFRSIKVQVATEQGNVDRHQSVIGIKFSNCSAKTLPYDAFSKEKFFQQLPLYQNLS